MAVCGALCGIVTSILILKWIFLWQAINIIYSHLVRFTAKTQLMSVYDMYVYIKLTTVNVLIIRHCISSASSIIWHVFPTFNISAIILFLDYRIDNSMYSSSSSSDHIWWNFNKNYKIARDNNYIHLHKSIIFMITNW